MPKAKPAATLDVRSLNRALLARQLLLDRTSASVSEVVHALAGLQSQEPRDPFVALFSRIAKFSRDDLLGPLRTKEIVRATYLRGTLHTATAADYLAYRATMLPVLEREVTSRKKLAGGFDEAAAIRATKSILRRGALELRALAAELRERFPEANEEYLAYFARYAVPFVIPPSDDTFGHPRPPRWALAETFLGAKPATKAAVGQVLLRAIAAFGPCSAADLRTWSRLPAIAPALEELSPELVVFHDEAGRTLYDLPAAPRPPRDVEAPIRFLPEYDNVFLSHDDRARIVAPAHQKTITAAANGRRLAPILIDGFVRATWALRREKKRAVLEIRLLEKHPKRLVSAISDEGVAMVRCVEPAHPSVDVEVAPL